MSLPVVTQHLIDFAGILRQHGFVVAPDQTIAWMAAITLLGPQSVTDIRRSGIATLAVPHDRQDSFDALFDAYFLGMALPAAVDGDEEETEAHEPDGTQTDVPADTDDQPSGEEATTDERLGHRALEDQTDRALARLRTHGPNTLPRQRARRLAPARRGPRPDLRRTARLAARNDGEVVEIARRKRKSRQRRIVLLIDVSGSMEARTEATLSLAHTLVRTADRVEVFTLGTRLTRITPALATRHAASAMARASGLIADIDGGTRIGEALQSFMDVPRFAGFARGASVVVLSDGLERGTPDALILAVARLSRLAWRIDWLSPLADGGTATETRALAAIRPWLDSLASGSDTDAVVTHLLTMARAA